MIEGGMIHPGADLFEKWTADSASAPTAADLALTTRPIPSAGKAGGFRKLLACSGHLF